MKTKDVIDHFGSVIEAAKAIGISRPAIYMWGQTVPEKRQFHIEVLTNGKLKADRKTKTDQSEAA